MGLERHPDEKRVETDIAVEIELSAEAGRAELPNVRGKLLRNGHEIGECFVHSAGEISSAPKAQTACSLDHFVLDEDERGKGLGRHLLQETLKEAWRLGYVRAGLETNARYYDRHLLYSSVGFRVMDNCYKFRKRFNA